MSMGRSPLVNGTTEKRIFPSVFVLLKGNKFVLTRIILIVTLLFVVTEQHLMSLCITDL